MRHKAVTGPLLLIRNSWLPEVLSLQGRLSMSCLPTLGPLLTPLNIHSKLGELTWELTAYAYEGVSKMDGLSTSLGTGGNDLMELEDTDAPKHG